MAVFSPEGIWTGAAGFARIEDQTPMEPCHLHFLQSVSKSYLAVAILKLHQEGRLRLDASITTYLPESFSRPITDAEKITVRMLLNHTSGVPEYNFDPKYVTFLLQNPRYIFQPRSTWNSLTVNRWILSPARSFHTGTQTS
jgi:D-alanyl-D-alanine carboxypeptidase